MKNFFLLSASFGIIVISFSVSYYLLVLLPQTNTKNETSSSANSMLQAKPAQNSEQALTDSLESATTSEQAYQRLLLEKAKVTEEIKKELKTY